MTVAGPSVARSLFPLIPTFDREDPALFAEVGRVIEQRKLFVLVGFDNLWEWPEDAYMVQVDDLTLLCDLSHYHFFAQGVVKSRSEFLITLHPDKTSQDLTQHFEEWNSAHTSSGFKRLENSLGEKIWERQGSLAFVPSIFRPEGAPPHSSSDFQIMFKGCDPRRLIELFNGFLRSSSAWYLGQQGLEPTKFSYTLYTSSHRGVVSNKALVCGVPLPILRGWYWQFREYPWTNSSGQTITITLTCSYLDDEMMRDSSVRCRAMEPDILSLVDSQYIGEYGTLPPPALTNSSDQQQQQASGSSSSAAAPTNSSA